MYFVGEKKPYILMLGKSLVSLVSLIVYLVVLQACATSVTIEDPSASIYVKHAGQRPESSGISESEKRELMDAYKKMFERCKAVLSDYDKRASNLGLIAFAIAVVGSISGAVIAPALIAAAPASNKVAISALSGTAGASNVAQGALEKQGLTSEHVQELRYNTRQEFKKAVLDFYEGLKKEDANSARKAITDGEIACMTYAVFDPKLQPQLPPSTSK